jgi:NAD(P)H-hydrate epimerase
LNKETVIVDALLGTGLKEDVRGAIGDAIDRLNSLPKKITRIAVDIPSGLDSDTGATHGRAVRADATYTMGLPKIGLVTSPGFEATGELHIVDIGIPRGLPEKKGLRCWLLEEADVARRVPVRPKSGHKGTFGHLLVVAGSHGKTGAALLCGESALRGGAGLVTLAVRPDVQKVLEGRVRELMTGAFADEAQLRALARGKRAVALGPGIATDDAMRDLVRRWAKELPLPMVIDADGLNLLAGAVDVLKGAAGPRLLTPHPGEMARLCDTTTEAVQSDRVGIARTLAARTGAFVALKGARTVIAAPDGRAFINPTGNPGMGTGGTGDVLTGLVGSLLAQGLDPLDALLLGVYCHGRAGDRAAMRKKSQRGLLARDLITELPAALTF